MKYLIIILLGIACSAPQNARLDEHIWPLMDLQQQAWNEGDIDGFMSIYDDEVCFLGRKGLTCGKKSVTANYRESYPDKAAMGRLEFNSTELTPVGNNAAWVCGRWTLFRAADTLAGNYSLLWHKTADGWRIFRDHSDSDCL